MVPPAEDPKRKRERMDALLHFAGGVAHHFNNMLTVVVGYSELALADLDRHHPAFSSVARVARAAEGIAEQTRLLLAFSGKQVLQPRPLELDGFLAGAAPGLERAAGDAVKVVVAAGAAGARVEMDPAALEMVLTHLVSNARDAMPHGGTCTVSTRPAGPDRIVLSVADDGIGMNETVQSHLFEPFYSTKDPSSAKGLGLAAVYGIVTQSAATIECASRPGEGTVFTITLPQVRSEPAKHSPAGETVLVVDPDPDARSLVGHVLERRGYTVLAAATADEAVALARRPGCSVDLLVADLTMTGTTAPALVESIRTLHPGLRALFLSGFEQAPAEVVEPDAVLERPFTPSLLLARVRERLG